MKVLILIAVVMLAGCANEARYEVQPNDTPRQVPKFVGYAAGYGVEKFQDGGVTCYVTEKVGYSGGGIACVAYRP